MSLRNRVNPQQLLAVSLALTMLVSVGAMAFVGGAAAQTGGTYDQVIDESEVVNSELNIASGDGDVQLVGPEDGTTGNVDPAAVDVLSDGDVDIDGNNVPAGEFAGAALTLDRVDALADVSEDPSNQSDYLEASVDDLAVDSGGDSFPAVFVEFAPQSNFSQIDTVSGAHDFIVIGPADELDGQTNTDLSVGNPNIDAAGDIVVVSASNGFTDDALLSAGDNFGTVISGVVGDTDADLQNENIDRVQIAAGLFGDGNPTDTITGIQLNPSSSATGETVHSEKITLVASDDSSERYFSTIGNAEDAAGTDDTIRVADGTFDAGVTLGVEGLTVERDDSSDTPEIPGTVTYNADSVTVDGFDIDTGDVTDNGTTLESPTLANSSVISTATPAVNFSSSNSATVTNNDIRDSGNAVIDDGEIGLDVSNGFETVTGNDIRDFQTQIAATSSEDMDALLNDNEFKNNDESQAAVPADATGAVQGGTIYGNIDAADANTDTGETVEVYGGTYDHSAAIDIATEDVSVVDVEDDATISNLVNIDAAGDVSVDGFDISANLDAAGGEPTSLTVNDTDVAANNIAADNVDTVSLDDTTANGEYDLGDGGTVGTVTLTDTTGGAYDIDATGTVDLTNADGDSNLNIVTDADVTVGSSDVAGDVTIDAGTGAVTVTDGSGLHYDITADGDVEVDGAEATDPTGNTNSAGIYVTQSAADVNITGADVTLTADGQIGVDVMASGESGEEITLTGVSVDGDGTEYNATGISFENINTGNSNTYSLNDNIVADLGGISGSPATGVNITEDGGVIDGSAGTFTFSNNTVTGGTHFIGLSYNLPETSNVEISENRIVGDDVTGAEDSIGVDFVKVDNFGAGGIIGSASTNGMQFTRNVITGHARLIQDQSSGDATVAASDYTAIANSGNDLNNEVGTVVLDAEGDYSAAYGSTDILYDANANDLTYLPGSIDEAVDLVALNTNIDTADLQVYEPTTTTDGNALTLNGVSEPDSYVEGQVDFPDVDQITVSGETRSVTAETNFLIDGGAGNEKNNHNIKSLTIDAGGATAIDVSVDKAQSEFEDLNVTTTGAGLTVDPATSDVNVIEVRDSTFDVGADGISLAGTNDDRDGFVIDTVTIDGDDELRGGDIGLNLTDVEKPGKDGLPVNFTVKDSTINNFTTQVAIDGGDGNLAANNVNATTFVEGTDVSEESITVENNTFGQAVVVFDTEGGALQSPDLYGSVDFADNDAAADGSNDVIEIRNLAAGTDPAFYDHGETVTIGTTDVTVAGPVEERGQAGLRDDEVIIEDSIETTADNVTLDGFAVVGDDSLSVLNTGAYGAADDTLGGTDTAVIGTTAGELTVKNLSVTSSVDPTADGIMPVGIGSNTADPLTIERTFVGDHAAGTTGSAVVAQQANLDVDDSTFENGSHGIDFSADTLDSSAYGVIAGDGTSPTITNTNISDFAADGINTEANGLMIEAGSTIANNNDGTDGFTAAGDGGIVTNDADGNIFNIVASAVDDNNGVGVDVEVDALNINNGATVSGNTGDGVIVDAGTVDVDDSTISNNDAGLTATNVDTEAEITDSTVEDNAVDVSGAVDASVTGTTFSADGATALTLAVDNATVSENTIEDSATGLDLTTNAQDDPAVTLNTIQNNDVGFAVSGASDAVVTGNTFNSTTTDIDSEVDLDATLNFFGDNQGPEGDDAAGIVENGNTVTYDPFLSEPKADTGVSTSAVESTTSFAHDVVIPADSTTSVGFPAQPDADREDVDQLFSADTKGTLFKWNQTEQQFDPVDFDSDSVEAFDAYVIDNEGSEETVTIEYQSDRSALDTPANTFEFKQGLNFVPPQEAGTVSEALFPGGDTDYVAQPFTTGENLYGATGSNQVRDQFTTPTEDGFAGNFRSGVGDAVVHPHAAYLVIVNENDNAGLTVSEQVPLGEEPTADTVAEDTGAEPTDYQLDSASATASAAGNSTTVVVDVENIGDIDGAQQDVTATALTSNLSSVADVTKQVTLNAGEEDTVEFTLEDGGGSELEAGDQVRVEITLSSGDSVKVTAVAE